MQYALSRLYLNCHLAGFTYWDGAAVFSELEPGTPLELVPEPQNPYDPSAVAFYFGSAKLGYVPSDRNATLAQLMNLGHADAFEARVSTVDPSAHPERQVRVSIFVTDAR